MTDIRPKLNIERFIEANEDWETRIKEAPYCVSVKTDGDYFLLKYNQLNSDFSDPTVKECRGVIFHRQDGLVCYPFSKFFNYGEENADKLDWSSAWVSEKIDGSLMKAWYHNGKWHLSTNNTIDAFYAVFTEDGLSFGTVFAKAISGLSYEDLMKNEEVSYRIYSEWCERNLNPLHVYLFELVSPDIRVVIEYKETKIYHLATRDMTSLEELDEEIDCVRPKRYPFRTLEDVIKAASELDKDHEGFVACDKFYHRVKVKGEQYLLAHHASNNGVITVKRILKMWKEEILDDFLAYAPQYFNKVNEVLDVLKGFERECEDEYTRVYRDGITPKEIFSVSNPKYAHYCVNKLSGKVRNAEEFVDKLLLSTVRRMVKARLKK